VPHSTTVTTAWEGPVKIVWLAWVSNWSRGQCINCKAIKEIIHELAS
jgi:hypothetical protein